MGNYILKPKTYHKFITLGYDLNCKICGVPIQPGDKVESKTGGSGPKLYHLECYEDSHYDLGEDDYEDEEY